MPAPDNPSLQTTSIRRRIAHILDGFGCRDAMEWPEAHPLQGAGPIDLDSM